MCPSLIEIGSKTAEKNSAQTNRQADRHYENNGHLAVNQHYTSFLNNREVVAGYQMAEVPLNAEMTRGVTASCSHELSG